MNAPLHDAGPSPEDHFADFLEEVEAGRQPDFDAFCAAHVEHEVALRRLHRHWSAMTQAFAALSLGGGEGRPVELVPAGCEALLTMLRADAGRAQRYAIGPEIAAGAMGRVVGAWDRELRREVALKIHRGDGGGRQLRRFLEEAQIAGQLDHPGIVPIHELGLDAEGRPFFAMRLVRGKDLGQVLELARTGADGWSRTRVVHVLLRVCEAMAYAHSKGVVHRDLKPGNVMVGPFGEVYVMDWGLARVTGDRAPNAVVDDGSRESFGLDSLRSTIAAEDDASPLLTQHGDVVGTPAYMAPELADGSAVTASPAADVYSLGAILHHLCAGRMPYVGAGEALRAAEVLDRLRSGPPQPLPADAPVELRAICERAMARDPAARHPGMVELGEDLRAYLDLRVVRTYASGPWAELRKWIERNRALSLALGVAALTLLVGVIVSTRLWVAADEAAAQLDTELARSEFRNARLSLELDDAGSAEDQLWRQHLAGGMPRATRWALAELHARSPFLVTAPAPTAGDGPVAVAQTSGEIAVGGDDGLVRVLGDDLAERRVLGTPGAEVRSVAIEPGGEWLLAGMQDGSLAVFDFADGRLLRRVAAHASELRGLAIAADGRRFATGGGDGRVLVWDGLDAAPQEAASHGTAAVRSLAFDGGGRRLASGAADGSLRLVSLSDQRVAELQLDDREIMALSFAPQADELWVGSATHRVFVLGLAPVGLLRVIPTRNGTCRDLAHDADGHVLAGGWWRLDRLAPDGSRGSPVALRGVWQFDVDPPRQRVVLSSRVTGLGVIDRSARGRQDLAARAIALSADGRWLAAARRDGVVLREVERVPDRERVVSGGTAGWLAIDGTGARLALQRGSGAPVEVFDLASGERLFEVEGPISAPFDESFAFSPDGRQLAVVAGLASVRRFAVPSGDSLGRDDVGPHQVLRLRWAADSATLAVICRQTRSVRLLGITDGSQRIVDCGELPTIAALSHDGLRLAVGNWQGLVLVFDLRTGARRELRAHAGTTFGLEFAPSDPDLLISSGGADGVTFWDLEQGVACLNVLRDDAPVQSFRISDDGRTLAARTVSGAVLLDLEYHDRHVAGNLAHQLERLRGEVAVTPAREAELRSWAAGVLARPWPRWAAR